MNGFVQLEKTDLVELHNLYEDIIFIGLRTNSYWKVVRIYSHTIISIKYPLYYLRRCGVQRIVDVLLFLSYLNLSNNLALIQDCQEKGIIKRKS